MRSVRVIAGVGMAVAVLGSGSAAAATRYASPQGVGSPATCQQADPCNLQDAVENAAVNDGDVIVVTAGTYNEANQLDVSDAITVGKDPGGAVPTVNTTASLGIRVADPGAVVHDLALNQTAGVTALLVSQGTAERMRVRTTQANACGATSSTADALLRDSTCLNVNPSSGAAIAATIGSGSGTWVSRLRNVTAYALGVPNGIGLNADANSGAAVVVDARNVVVSGALADVRADFTAPSPATVVTMTSSNYATATEVTAGSTITDPGTGGNQIAEPLLADPASNDFTELAGSQTINAGTVDGFLGVTDVQGGARIEGVAPDIGADEYDPIAPATTIDSGPPAVDRNNRPTFAFSSNEVGSTFECQVGAAAYGSCASPYTSEILEQGFYVFRVRATDIAGNVDASPAEYAFEIDRGISGANASAKRKQRKRGRRVSIAVSVKAGEDVQVSAGARVRLSKKKAYTFKSKSVDLAAGAKRKLVLKPERASAGRKILKVLRRGGKVKATVAATFSDDAGNTATTGDIAVKLK